MAFERGRGESVLEAKRVYWLLTALIVYSILMVGRFWYLQIIKGKEFSVASERNQFREVARPAPRGLIFDRDGAQLLSNRPFFDLVIIPQYLPKKDREKTVRIISELFHIPFDFIEKKLAESTTVPKFVPIRIKRNLALHEVAMVESNKFFIPGIDVDIVPRRDYGRGEQAHLLGYLGEVGSKELDKLNAQSKNFSYHIGSIIGKLGVEKKYEQFLRGFEGKDFLQVDAQGRLNSEAGDDLGVERRIEAKRGMDVYLTIDADVQKAAFEAFRNKNGALIAVNAKNGEVLAYVSNPNFSLSIYQDGLSGEDWQSLQANPFKPLLDKVTGGAYPPGSTYKMITAIAALEEGVVTPDRTYHCNGVFTFAGIPWRCWKKGGHGTVNMRRAVEQSCDVYFYQVGNLLGADRIAKWGKLFGLGEKTGLDLNMEVEGILPSTEWKIRAKNVPWQGGDTINMSIGQGFNLTTPIQIAMAYAAMGNGGHLYRPFLLKKIMDERGKLLKEEKPLERRFIPMKEETMRIVGGGLQDVVMSPTGTGKRAQVKGFTVSGKTGTAQTAALKKTKDKDLDDVAFQQRDHAWFAAFSPSENAEIAVVVLSEYDGGGGGAQAAPIVQKVLEAYWRKKHPEKFPSSNQDILLKNTAIVPFSAGETLPAQTTESPENRQANEDAADTTDIPEFPESLPAQTR
jgi:penicillin-binding protein 2